MQVEFISSSREERLSAFEFLEGRRVGLGIRFSREIDDAVERIQRSPQSFAIEPHSMSEESVRYVRLATFPYRLVFLLVNSELAVIVAVVHDAQRPGFWRGRL